MVKCIRNITFFLFCGLFLCGLPQKAASQNVSIRTNLLYDATATPNLAMEFQLGEHFSLGLNGGLKPWPRWLAWDWDQENPVKWRHLSVAPEFRWYPRTAFDGWFLGVNALYLHYNAGKLQFPFGLYPALRDSRLQGDFYGGGLSGGYSWYLSAHFRLELELGLQAGYYKATQYECPHCGKELGTPSGVGLIPKLGVNIAYDFKRRQARQKVLGQIRKEENNN